MIQKHTIYKRKLRGVLSLVFFSAFLFLGIFIVCFAVWIVLKTHSVVKSPLAKIISMNSTGWYTTKIQALCVSIHSNCTNIIVHSDNTATVTIDTDEQVILSLQKDLKTQFSSLQLTIGHLTIDGKRFHRLDFRFDKPVILY